jgi:hypothetical protein
MSRVITAGTEVKHVEKNEYAHVVGISDDAIVADFGDGAERVSKGLVEVV